MGISLYRNAPVNLFYTRPSFLRKVSASSCFLAALKTVAVCVTDVVCVEVRLHGHQPVPELADKLGLFSPPVASGSLRLNKTHPVLRRKV